MDTTNRTRVNLKLEPDIHAKLTVIAKAKGYTIQGFLDQVIKTVIEAEEETKPVEPKKKPHAPGSRSKN